MTRRIEMYDTTLRDGTQGLGVSLSLPDKLKITRLLDELGFDFIEGGYPLSNPKDTAYFEQVRDLGLKHAKVCAFGMTRRRGVSCAEDEGMRALTAAGAPVITIVGKTWDLHVDEVLRVGRDENLDMIRESVAWCRDAAKGPDAGDQPREVFYDAEHFFDGYRANPDYAMQTLQAAIDGGASRLVLCDTNGGSLPAQIADAVTQLKGRLAVDDNPDPASLPSLAIHPHNDGGLAVANALAAVDAGCVQVQGTINGIGERCGNVDLVTVAANLRLKLGMSCLGDAAMQRLTGLAALVAELSGAPQATGQPFVGAGAFAHKGGMHVHAVQRVAHSYEHIDPAEVGNERRVLVSELSGASNIAATLGKKFGIDADKEAQRRVLQRVQDLEHQGYHFEDAEASAELIAYEQLLPEQTFWQLDHYRCSILKRDSQPASTEATVKLHVGDTLEHQVAEGDGPVNALDAAMRRCLLPHYPQLSRVHLSDYKVRVVNPSAESAARVRATIEFTSDIGDGQTRVFSTVGVDENIIDASWRAIADAFRYHLLESQK